MHGYHSRITITLSDAGGCYLKAEEHQGGLQKDFVYNVSARRKA
jgi:hypothetical protein